jgi:hypothetical protein
MVHRTRMSLRLLWAWALLLSVLVGCSMRPQPVPISHSTNIPTETAPAEATPTDEAMPTAATDAAPSEDSAAKLGAADCPAAEGAVSVVQVGAGYCFLIPAGYTTNVQSPDQIVVVPETIEGQPALAYVKVEPATGGTAEAAADAKEASISAMGMNLTRTVTTLGGLDAVVLDGLPGQDVTRMLFVVQHDRLYELTFTPFDPRMGEVFRQMEELYAQITGSFTFLHADD